MDHRLYPHIFDLILSYTDPSVHFTLRQTSKAIQAKADTLLRRHLVITSCWPSVDRAFAVHTRSGCPLPNLAPAGLRGDAEAGVGASEAWAALVGPATVVDIIGVVLPKFEMDALAAAAPNVATVRLIPDSAGAMALFSYFSAHTLVLFPDVAAIKGEEDGFVTTYPHSTVRRVVCNVRHHSNAGFIRRRIDDLANVQEVVYVFSHFRGGAGGLCIAGCPTIAGGNVADANAGSEVLGVEVPSSVSVNCGDNSKPRKEEKRWAEFSASLGRALTAGVRITLVDFENAPPSWYGFEPHVTPTDVQGYIEHLCEKDDEPKKATRGCAEGCPTQMKEKAGKAVGKKQPAMVKARFLSSSEWVRELAGGQATLKLFTEI